MSEVTAGTSDAGAGGDAPKLYANKYKTIEDMEAALKAKDSESVKMQQRLKELETKSQTKVVPEVYDVPDHASSLGDEVERYKAMGQAAKLSQDEFNHIINGALEERKQKDTRLNENKKIIGDKTVSILEEFVNNNTAIPAALKKQALENLLTNENERIAALQEREKKLNSKVPGMDSSFGGKFEGDNKATDVQKDVLEAGRRWEKRPHDKVAQAEFIEAAAAAAEAKKNK